MHTLLHEIGAVTLDLARRVHYPYRMMEQTKVLSLCAVRRCKCSLAIGKGRVLASRGLKECQPMLKREAIYGFQPVPYVLQLFILARYLDPIIAVSPFTV